MSAHAEGQVDVIVTNPDGQADRPSGGYVYASPRSFDFNGDWGGGAGSEQDASLRFTIQNNVLVSVSCGTSSAFTWSPPPSVSNGEFSFSSDDGVGISGRIVSASAARGTINIPPCTGTTWVATKQ